MNRVLLNGFLAEELNNQTKDLILKTIRVGLSTEKFKDELIFNRYSLEILFGENQIIIYDDVYEEDEPLKINLLDFENIINKQFIC